MLCSIFCLFFSWMSLFQWEFDDTSWQYTCVRPFCIFKWFPGFGHILFNDRDRSLQWWQHSCLASRPTPGNDAHVSVNVLFERLLFALFSSRLARRMPLYCNALHLHIRSWRSPSCYFICSLCSTIYYPRSFHWHHNVVHVHCRIGSLYTPQHIISLYAIIRNGKRELYFVSNPRVPVPSSSAQQISLRSTFSLGVQSGDPLPPLICTFLCAYCLYYIV